jgi:hypothetical protein
MEKVVSFSPPDFIYPVWINLRHVIGRRDFALESLETMRFEMKHKIIDKILFDLRDAVVFLEEMRAKVYRERHLRAFSRIQLRNSSRVKPSGMDTKGPSSAFSILR